MGVQCAILSAFYTFETFRYKKGTAVVVSNNAEAYDSCAGNFKAFFQTSFTGFI